MKNKLFLGITGLAGSGKSTVSNIIRNLNYPVIDLDRVGHSILNDQKIESEIREYFGDSIFDVFEDKLIINRKKLGNIVFNDLDKLNFLNSIMWPSMYEKVLSIKDRLFKSIDIVFLDGAIIYQASFDKICDFIIWVDCDDHIRKQRLSERIGALRSEKLMRSQKEMILFRERADIIINNKGSLNDLERDVKELVKLMVNGE